MKRFKTTQTLLLGTVFAALLFGAAAPTPPGPNDHEGTVEDPWPLYDQPTLQIKANAYDDRRVAKVVVHAATEPTFENIVLAHIHKQLLPGGTPIEVPIYEQVKALPDGIYYLRCQIEDACSHLSPFSDPIVVEKVWTQPEPPGGCFITF